MSWYTEKGPVNDIVSSSRVRLARNIKGYPFPHLLSDSMAEDLILEVHAALISAHENFAKDYTLYKMQTTNPIFKQTLIEKHLISRELAGTTRNCAVLINQAETISIMINEEDHLRIQSILPGSNAEEAIELSRKISDLLSEKLEFSKSDKFGYLTACPSNVGTGIRISAMLHLPALSMSGSMNALLNSVGRAGMTVRGMYGEGTTAVGSFYQLSNQVTLGLTEQDILKKFQSVLEQMIDFERKTRASLLSSNEAAIKNRCLRSYGNLKYSWSITSEELINFLSDVRLGVSLGIISLDIDKLNYLMVSTQPSCLIQNGITSATQRDIKRAQMVAEVIS